MSFLERHQNWQVHPYFHSSLHISITIQAIMLKFYDFVDKGTDCVLTKNDTVPSHNKQVITQQQKQYPSPYLVGAHTPILLQKELCAPYVVGAHTPILLKKELCAPYVVGAHTPTL